MTIPIPLRDAPAQGWHLSHRWLRVHPVAMALRDLQGHLSVSAGARGGPMNLLHNQLITATKIPILCGYDYYGLTPFDVYAQKKLQLARRAKDTTPVNWKNAGLGIVYHFEEGDADRERILQLYKEPKPEIRRVVFDCTLFADMSDAA
jgi:hypothetical protein